MNRYKVKIFWLKRQPTEHEVIALNRFQAIDCSVRSFCADKSEMYDHIKTERNTREV